MLFLFHPSIHSSVYLCVFISLVFDLHVTSTRMPVPVYAVRASNALASCINAELLNHLLHACSNRARKNITLYIFQFESYHFRRIQQFLLLLLFVVYLHKNSKRCKMCISFYCSMSRYTQSCESFFSSSEVQSFHFAPRYNSIFHSTRHMHVYR